jgi:hypothetical protein
MTAGKVSCARGMASLCPVEPQLLRKIQRDVARHARRRRSAAGPRTKPTGRSGRYPSQLASRLKNQDARRIPRTVGKPAAGSFSGRACLLKGCQRICCFSSRWRPVAVTVRPGRAPVEAVEGTAALSSNGKQKRQARGRRYRARRKEQPETTAVPAAEGHPYPDFFHAPVTARLLRGV